MVREKMFHLTKLLQLSQRTVLVLDSATSCSPSLTSAPSPLHRAVVSLERAGLVQTLIALDPWALAQKAGFPQHKMIELCGSKFDPSNPPTPTSGDEDNTNKTVTSRLQREVKDADLVVVLSPSSGQLHLEPLQQLMQCLVDRSALGRGYMGGGALGLVSMGRAEAGDNRGLTLNIRHQVRRGGALNVIRLSMLQVSDIMEDLLRCLNIEKQEPTSSSMTTLDSLELRAEVEYEKCGCRLGANSTRQLMTLDLSVGQKVKIVSSHSHKNLEKEDPPNKLRSYNKIPHQSTQKPGKSKQLTSRRTPRLCDLVSGAGRPPVPPPGGHRVGVVRGVSTHMEALVISVDRARGEEAMLGLWWLEDIRAGLVENIPLVNISPRMTPRTGCGVCQREN